MLYFNRRGLKSVVDWCISWLILTIDDVINAKKKLFYLYDLGEMCGVDLAEDSGLGLSWGGGVVGIVGLSSISFFGTSWTIKWDKSRNLCDRGGIGGCENFLTRDSETKKIRVKFDFG